MRCAPRAALPLEPPGLTAAELKAGLCPAGEKAGWWMKCVQLDLEAKGEIRRADTKPLCWWALA